MYVFFALSNGDRRWGQLALSLSRELKDTPENQLDCELAIAVKSTHDVLNSTWKCGSFFPTRRRIIFLGFF